ncbi:MAG: DUF3267 domain-containing protein [Aureispira sp.]
MEIKKELTASGMKLNIILIPFIVLAYVFLVEGYDLFWGDIRNGDMGSMAFVLTFVVCIILHEALHGLTWMWASALQLSDIKYGFIWKALMPFAHSKKPLSKRAYQLGAVMPGLVLGFFPYLLGILIGQPDVAFIGMVMTLSAAGDAWVLWIIRKEPLDVLIMDHPSKPGCYVVAPASDSISMASAI